MDLGTNLLQIGEPWEKPRIWLECSELKWKQEAVGHGKNARKRILIDDNVGIQINDGVK